VYIGKGVTYFSSDFDAVGATYWQRTDAGAWSYYDGDSWDATRNFNWRPHNVWYHGFGADAGWERYDTVEFGSFSSVSKDQYYTHDMKTYWRKAIGGEWKFYNTKEWVVTDKLGDAPYGDGANYGAVNTWFEGTGSYTNVDIYIGAGVTYYSLDHSAAGANYWAHYDSNGTWTYYDGSAWLPVAGLYKAPQNVWFHGSNGWDVYDYQGGVYATKGYVVFWDWKDTGEWKFYNTKEWVVTDKLGDAPYGDGAHYGAVKTWFKAPAGLGAYTGYDVYIGEGVTYYSLNHSATPATFWAHYDSNGAWAYYDGTNWGEVSGFGVKFSIDDRIEYWVLYYVNQYRENPVNGPWGVPAAQPDLIFNASVDLIAEKHLQDILNTHVWDHNSAAFPVGWQTLEDRASNIGWPGWGTCQIGENLTIQYTDINGNGNLDQGTNEIGSVNWAGWTDAQARTFAQNVVWYWVENDASSAWGHRSPITNEQGWTLYYAGVAAGRGVVVINFSQIPL
jgi:hypothetical protein